MKAEPRQETLYVGALARFDLYTAGRGMSPGVASSIHETRLREQGGSWVPTGIKATMIIATRKDVKVTQAAIDSLHLAARDAAVAHVQMRLAKLASEQIAHPKGPPCSST